MGQSTGHCHRVCLSPSAPFSSRADAIRVEAHRRGSARGSACSQRPRGYLWRAIVSRATSWGQLESLRTSVPAQLRHKGVILRIRSGRRNVSALLLWACAALLMVVTGVSYYTARTAAPRDHSESSTRTRTCNRGFRDDGNSCVVVRLPLNASLVRAGDDWKCDPHFVKRHSACVAVQRHANALPDSSGADEDCGADPARQNSPACAAHSPAQTSSAIALLALAALRSFPH